MNRNTFYYHYQDLPALAETIAVEDVERIVGRELSLFSVENCLDRCETEA